MSEDARSAALLALSRFLVSEVSVEETLRRVAEIAVSAVPGAEIAGITLLGPDGEATTGVYTDETSPQVDASQYSSGRGPCLDAWRQQRSVILPDVCLASDRYPEFATAAGEHGIGSTLSLPLAVAGHGIGALNLYSRQLEAFGPDDEVIGSQVAATASTVLANATAYRRAFQLSEQLGEAMASRAVIEQAKGVIMSSVGCSADAAFDILRQQSQAENAKLRDIATDLVAQQDRHRPSR
ncbi:MAG TPA: GAF and ANTAR domain-containing protein [Acidimicrobiales bacterium]|jgi:GAF domain-containing protein